MIQTEIINERLIRTYSDAGVKIHGGNPEADYDSAIDPIEEHRTYVETDIPVDDIDEDATTEDYEQALAQLGVE